jgi:hypothetical protein
MENQEKKEFILKTWWFWTAVVILLVVFVGLINNSQQPQSVSKNLSNTNTVTTVTPQKADIKQSVTKPNSNTSQTNSSDIQGPPRDSDGTIHQLKINASAESRSIAFTSEEDYTNCTDDINIITVDENQLPVFTLYKDKYSAGINLFAGDQHSIAFASLTDENGDTLASDIISGKYGANTAGNWGLTCDQGQYSLEISQIK